jgi:hypothetical protein
MGHSNNTWLFFPLLSNSGKIGDQMSLAIKMIGYSIYAIKWSGDQMVKIDRGDQMSGELMAGDQMAGELMS